MMTKNLPHCEQEMDEDELDLLCICGEWGDEVDASALRMMMKNKIYIGVVILMMLTKQSFANERDATVTMNGNSYGLPVEVEDGEVTQVYWQDGRDPNISGADLSDGQASGTNENGDPLDIELDD